MEFRGDNEKSLLSDFVLRCRTSGREKPPSQEDFQTEDLQYTTLSQYVSKIERGNHPKKVNQEFLEALSRFTKINEDLAFKSVKELREMSIRKSNVTGAGESRKLRIAFGHCLWATPVLLTAVEDPIENFQFNSFGVSGEDPWAGSFEPSVNESATPSAGQNDPISYSARQIIEGMRDGLVDVGAFPFDAIRDDCKSEFIRLAKVVDTTDGCTLVHQESEFNGDDTFEITLSLAEDLVTLPSELNARGVKHVAPRRLRQRFKPLDHTLSQHIKQVESAGCKVVDVKIEPMNNWVDQFLKREKQICIGVETHTVGYDFLIDALENSNDEDQPTAREIAFAVPNSDFQTMCFEELRSLARKELDRELVGVITWEPHASWLVENSRKKSVNLLKRSLRFHKREGRSERRVTYDIMVHQKHYHALIANDGFHTGMSTFLDNLSRKCEEIESWRDVDDDRDAVKFIAEYFGLISEDKEVSTRQSLERVLESLQRIHFQYGSTRNILKER